MDCARPLCGLFLAMASCALHAGQKQQAHNNKAAGIRERQTGMQCCFPLHPIICLSILASIGVPQHLSVHLGLCCLQMLQLTRTWMTSRTPAEEKEYILTYSSVYDNVHGLMYSGMYPS
eukprot:1152442-Pelagomonas_calceolata.AAC.5